MNYRKEIIITVENTDDNFQICICVLGQTTHQSPLQCYAMVECNIDSLVQTLKSINVLKSNMESTLDVNSTFNIGLCNQWFSQIFPNAFFNDKALM